MPELPEVETVMRALAKRLDGRSIRSLIQRRADLRFPLPVDLERRLVGRRLVGFARRAKYLLIAIDDGQSLLLHLGMSGRLLLDGQERGPHEHLTFGFDDGTVLRFVDPRRFGMLDLAPTESLPAHRWLAGLGVEPLSAELTPARLTELLGGSAVAIKTAIMDQRRIVGVGNIYASEALFRARTSPQRLAREVTVAQTRRIVPAIKQVLAEAIEAGGSSLRDYVQTDGELGNFQRNFKVYGCEGEPCTRCGRPILRLVQGGRATYCCPRCQR